MPYMQPKQYAFFGAVLPFVSGALFITSFATDHWLDTNSTHWGLWKECVKENKTMKQYCRFLDPGDTTENYDATRAIACFALVCYLLVVLSTLRCRERPNKLCQSYNPAIMSSVAVALSVTLMVFSAVMYDEGNSAPWSGMDAKLSWSYWLLTGAVAGQFLAAVVLFLRGKDEAIERVGAGQPKPCLNPEHLDTLKFMFPILTMILYIAGFATPSWAEGQAGNYTKWGLWQICETNGTAWAKESEEKCESIAAGYSDGYLEAARVLSCFALVCYVVVVPASFKKEGEGDPNAPVLNYYLAMLLELIGVALTIIIIGVVGSGYKDDANWKDKELRLSYSYYLIVGAAAAGILSSALLLRHGNKLRIAMKKKRDDKDVPTTSLPTRVQVHPQPSTGGNAETTDRRLSSPSTVNNVEGNTTVTRITDSRLPSIRSADNAITPISSGENRLPPIESSDNRLPPIRSAGATGQFPILTLPRYDLPEYPGDGRPIMSPPPSYEDVMGSDNNGTITLIQPLPYPPPYPGRSEPKNNYGPGI